MESWFLASDVLLLCAGCVYMRLTRDPEGGATTMHVAMEILMFTGLCGGLLMAAVVIVIDIAIAVRDIVVIVDPTTGCWKQPLK